MCVWVNWKLSVQTAPKYDIRSIDYFIRDAWRMFFSRWKHWCILWYEMKFNLWINRNKYRGWCYVILFETRGSVKMFFFHRFQWQFAWYLEFIWIESWSDINVICWCCHTIRASFCKVLFDCARISMTVTLSSMINPNIETGKYQLTILCVLDKR